MTPIRIKVDPSHDASKVKAEGPGLSRSGKETIFMLFKSMISYGEWIVLFVILGPILTCLCVKMDAI